MITTAKEFYANLYRIQDQNPPTLALLLPSEERIYNVDLNTRTIEAPEYLSVETDHRAEAIYFKMPRFFGNVDLTETTGIIQYINADGENHIYQIPFYDIETADTMGFGYEEPRQMMIFPWLIDYNVAKTAGIIQYSIRFFVMFSETQILYDLHTLPSKSKILKGINFDEEDFMFLEVSLTENNYEAGKYYIKDAEGNYVISDDAFDAGTTYYIENNFNNDVSASLLDYMLELSHQAAERDLYWIVI